jgi:hypothetical protein
MGVFFWGWQLVRSYSPKFSSLRLACPRDAGEWSLSLFTHSLILSARIVEFASQEDSQRAIRELSEQSLLGRPVFIREVCQFTILVVPMVR